MNCLDCNAKFKLKEIKSTERYCPSCGHEIVAMPKEDGISDRQIAKLLRELATEEQLPVFPEHLAYALAARPVSQASSIGCAVFGGMVALGVIGLQIWLLPVMAIIAWIAWSRRKRGTQLYDKALKLSRRFGHVNHAFPHDRGETPQTTLDETLGATCQQVLVISNERFANYLHEAQFPLPVLGPQLAELTLYPQLAERLEGDPGLKILLATDHTPAGLAFVQKLPEVLTGRTDIKHIGMDAAFVSKLESAGRPLSDFPGHQAPSSKSLGSTGADLFALGPAVMIGALAVALTTMMLVAPEAAASGHNYENDSE